MAKWLSVLAAATFAAAAHGAVADQTAPTVIELFTSQGCSSCPPADELVGELGRRSDIIALSYNVDYWDYIGWRDTFATAVATKRQKDYGRAFGQRYVYTPQLVIAGRSQRVGSDRLAVAMAIDEAKRRSALDLTVSRSDDGQFRVRIPAGEGRGDVWLVRFDSEREVAVEGGENAGKTLRYYNVVRDIRRIGEWTGRPLDIRLAAAELQEGGLDGCAVLVQAPNAGPILGAARIDLSGGDR